MTQPRPNAQPSQRGQQSRINGLTDPYLGTRPAARAHAYGYTFRWVKGDRYVAVQRGTCVDGRRSIIVRDHLDGHNVLEGSQPLVDVIPIDPTAWNRPTELRRVVDAWAAGRNLTDQA
ncbi:MAG TPA: hypothetical protein VHX38_17015 [Pseudonocardiaceae bacterium]|nr:hypothetical protein [Pseudonocardiaceae bacterium]